MPPASMRCIRSSRLRRSDGRATSSNRHWCRWSSELFREIPNEELSALFDVLLGPEIYDEKVDLLKRLDSPDPNPDFATALETLIQARLDRGARMVPFSSCKGLSAESIMPDAIGMLGSTIRLAKVAKPVSPCLHMRLTRAFGLKAQASEIGERELRHIISFQCVFENKLLMSDQATAVASPRGRSSMENWMIAASAPMATSDAHATA